MLAVERAADYLRWIAPSIVVLVGYPVTVIMACWLTAAVTQRFLTRRHEIQNRAELQATIKGLEKTVRSRERVIVSREHEIGELKARIRENHALVSQLAMNYGVINTEEGGE